MNLFTKAVLVCFFAFLTFYIATPYELAFTVFYVC